MADEPTEVATNNDDASATKKPAAPKKRATPKKAARKVLSVPDNMKKSAQDPEPSPEASIRVEHEDAEDIPTDNKGRPMGRVKGGRIGGGRDNRNDNRNGNRNRKGNNRGRDRDRERNHDRNRDDDSRQASKLSGDPFDVAGLFEGTPKGFGFLRVAERNYEQSREDVFISPDLVQSASLRPGQFIKGKAQQGNRGPQLVSIDSLNDLPVDEARNHPHFEELKAVFPSKRIGLETTPDRFTTRVVDILAPVGRGQRGLIVSPPRAGKTTLLLHIAEAVQELHEETLHLMICLVDERPEEVTEFKRQCPDAEIYASSNDEPPRNHCRLAELCIERAKRLVEGGQHVFLLMDSITRLARAYNNQMGGNKRQSRGRGIQSGGIMAGALEMPRRLFAAARNTREAGSLTILGTALVHTNSKADDAIFQEFKGTGNMELVLDRKLAEHFVYPAVDIFRSGTRREELLLPDHTLHKINLIRRGLAGHREIEAMERLLFFLKKFPNNAQMLLEIKG
ncbi:MAG: transcription termination factor Rho [Verrucomicrobiota bacterium]